MFTAQNAITHLLYVEEITHSIGVKMDELKGVLEVMREGLWQLEHSITENNNEIRQEIVPKVGQLKAEVNDWKAGRDRDTLEISNTLGTVEQDIRAMRRTLQKETARIARVMEEKVGLYL